jgi:ligand-binding sensor domain-containing protein
VPVNDVVVLPSGGLLASTDLGVVSRAAKKQDWSTVGTNLPTTAVLDLHVGPDGNLYVATHGRGIWRTPVGRL